MKWALLLGFLCYIPSGAQEIVAYNEPVIASSESTQKVTLEHGATNSSYTEGTTGQQQSSSPTLGATETENASTSPRAEEQSGWSANSMPTASERYSDGTFIPATKSKAMNEISVGPKSDGTQAMTTENSKPEPTDSTFAGTTVLDVNATDESRGQTMANHGPASDTTSGHGGAESITRGTHANQNSSEGSSNASTTLAALTARDTKRSSPSATHTKSRSDEGTADGAYSEDENATQGSSEATGTIDIKETRSTIALDKANSGRTAAATSLYPGRVKTTYEASNESETAASSDVFNNTLSSDNWNATTSSPAESPCGKTDGSECSTQEIIDQNVKKCKRIFIISFVISLAILMAYTVFSGLHGMLRKKSKKL